MASVNNSVSPHANGPRVFFEFCSFTLSAQINTDVPTSWGNGFKTPFERYVISSRTGKDIDVIRSQLWTSDSPKYTTTQVGDPL